MKQKLFVSQLSDEEIKVQGTTANKGPSQDRYPDRLAAKRALNLPSPGDTNNSTARGSELPGEGGSGLCLAGDRVRRGFL